MIKTLLKDLLVTGFSAIGAARLVEIIATNVFGSSDPILVQWVVASVVGAIGLLATYYKVRELLQPQAGGRA